MPQYSVCIMGFLAGGLPMLTNMLLDSKKLTFRSKFQIILQKWAAAVSFIFGLILIALNPSILSDEPEIQIDDWIVYYCSMVCCIFISIPFVANFGLRSKSNSLRKLAKVSEGKHEEKDGKDMTIMFSYLFISVVRIILALLVYMTYCFTQESILEYANKIFYHYL